MTRGRKQVYLSVIIPAYNAGKTLPFLLRSLSQSVYTRFEVIIGDDGSRDAIELPEKNNTSKFRIHIVRLKKNRGPAAARNAAAKKARGRVLVFLDSDVEVYPDTIGTIAQKFTHDPDLTAITGVWDKHQKHNHWFPQFKALRDWSYWTNERDREGYYYLFSTRIAAIKSDVFKRLGGFNESFRQMEDVEITYRIARRYAIIFSPDVKVHHEFEGFVAVAYKYFWRSYYWTRLFSARKKFDPVATTLWETASALFGVASLVMSSLTLLAWVVQSSYVAFLALMSAGIFFVHILLLRRFLLFVYHEKGVVFMFYAIVAGLLLYCSILAGAVWYRIHSVVQEKH